ncbi:HutD family protein [Sinomonas atrocyanea]|uniref:HutD/Ves family protein n=1 Tax=Sinomonas atrocyanea TaxID=37927 RepID=UPI002789C8A2|nr:HutD family protein [Sinomonas atrocyanea]MDQ0260275.1 environmental stress-induced protein Ves [Sinomonas atrocyanea]MDR6620336.1 environmental stress-induced protein Ves [Sinomonas atrocyanea]
MPPHIIRFADLAPARWRNGGGTTVEIARGSHPGAVQPAGGDWDWRLSIAEVERAGDFSSFEGMDRVLTVIDGELLVLTVDGREHGLERYRPLRFDGGAPASAVLPTGPIRDLNLITRRGACTGYVTILELSKKRALPLGPGQLGVLLQGDAVAAPGMGADGGATTSAQDDSATPLARYDTVVGGEPAPTVSGRGFLAVVSVVEAEQAEA